MELLLQVLKWLSPEDLATLGMGCHYLRTPSADDSLWRRCYCARWGPPKNRRGSTGANKVGGAARVNGTWKAMYFERDREELQQAVAGAPPSLRQIYEQMQAAKRSQAPESSTLDGDDVLISLTETEHVARWRSQRGLGDGTGPACRHRCSGLSCAYHQIGDIFLCETTGRAHVCDETCRERVIDMDGMSEACSISGRSFDRMLSDGDIAVLHSGAGGAPDNPEDQAAGDEAHFFEKGYFGRLYEAGYTCENERELHAAMWGGDGSGALQGEDEEEGEEDEEADDGEVEDEGGVIRIEEGTEMYLPQETRGRTPWGEPSYEYQGCSYE